MGVQRKCPQCGHWNGDQTHCMNCRTLLDPIIIEEEREKVREQQRFRPPDKFDIFIDKWKHSKYWILRVIFQILYSILVIFFAIAGFFAWLAASPNG